ncbi:LCP family protein [Holdemanella sp. MSK.7.32]|uniref:LCP family protein n=1 Tax=Holdemanella sp. MSK.7.32 TaxID=2965273 RepID=UPI00210ACF96|nr:LCP family protein [Holdemanella sp. MSK.7.32]MCQ4803734.1 LCP family protein [Holdemanella sp. MSK.7.32]
MSKKDVKLSQNVKKKKKKNKRRLAKLMTVFIFATLALLIFQMKYLDLLPMKLIVLISAVLLIIALIITLIMNFKVRRFIPRLLVGLISLCMCLGLAYGNYFIHKTKDTFEVVTSLADKKAITTSIISMKDSGITKETDLKKKKIGTILEMDKEATQRTLKALKEEGIKYSTEDYSSLEDLVYALYDSKVDAICLNEKYRDILHETEAFFAFNTSTKVVYQNVHYVEREASDNESDPVNDITKDAFTILVSGNDSYGSLQDANTRSDANMLLTVNPKTGTILMTSIPRDYYVDLICPGEGEMACPEGSKDKLTHSGLLGIKSTEKSIENALGIKINYNIRINFSSVVNLVDALDGIDLDIKEGEQCDILYANMQPGLSVGKHHVDGETALAFARERHAYVNGDNQRVKNQQKVFKAIFKRIVSPKMITNYGKFMDALAVAFDTNISGDEISDFIKYELNNMPKWKFESYTIYGESANDFCYEAQSYASVTYQNDLMNEIARNKIKAVLKGKSSNTVEDTSGYSQEPSADNVIHQTDEADSYGDSEYYDPSQTYDYENQYSDENYDISQDDLYSNGEIDYSEEPSYDNYDEGQ